MSLMDYFENEGPNAVGNGGISSSLGSSRSPRLGQASGFPHSETSIFVIEKVQFQFPGRLLKLVVSHNVMVLGLENLKVLRIDLKNAEVIEDITVERFDPSKSSTSPPPDQISSLHLDPQGKHLLISTNHGQNYYVHSTLSKARHLPKLKGIHITAVAWSRVHSSNSSGAGRGASKSTGSFLIGSDTGNVYELEIDIKDSGDEAAGKTTSYFRIMSTPARNDDLKRFKLVFSLPSRDSDTASISHKSISSVSAMSSTPTSARMNRSRKQNTDTEKAITGLRFEQFLADNRKYVVFISTLTRLYQVIGRGQIPSNLSSPENPTSPSSPQSRSSGVGFFESLFAVSKQRMSCYEVPNPADTSKLCFMQEHLQSTSSSKLAWVTGAGTYYGALSYGSQNSGDSVLIDPVLLELPLDDKLARGLLPATPGDAVLTGFHLLYLFGDRIKAVWPLDAESDRVSDQAQVPTKVVWEQALPVNINSNPLLGLESDSVTSTYWLYTHNSIYELVITDEDREVWKWHLERDMFEQALTFAKNPIQKDTVLRTQAQHYFEQGRFTLAAGYFAQVVGTPFEDVCLKFMAIGQKDALRTYLTKVAERMMKKKEWVQVTMVVTWLLEEYLSAINEVELKIHAAVFSGDDETQLQEDLTHLNSDLRELLATYQDHVDRTTTFNMLLGYGRTTEFLSFAQLTGEHARILEYWISERKWEKALSVMAQQPDPELNYKYASTLMEHAPNETVNVWMRQRHLNPRNLIPAILKYNRRRDRTNPTVNPAIRYLEFIVGTLKNRDPAMHNLLLSLYVQQLNEKKDFASPLLQFLKQEDSAYSSEYALRLCLQHDLHEACVFLYGEMGMTEEAVELAIRMGDLELAKLYADRPVNDSSLRKKLWLQIARHVVQKEKNIKKAMECLQKRDLLRIEDILPCFPDFVVIDDFKEEMCEALEEYNAQIEELKVEMDEATRSAERLRRDIKEVNRRYIVLTPSDRCNLCRGTLMPHLDASHVTSASLPTGSSIAKSTSSVVTHSLSAARLQQHGRDEQFYVFPCRHFFHADCLIDKVVELVPPRTARRIADLRSAIAASSGKFEEKASGMVGQLLKTPKALLPWGDQLTDMETSAESRNLAVLRDELDELVANECFLCGSLMIRTIDLPFIDASEAAVVAAWAIT